MPPARGSTVEALEHPRSLFLSERVSAAVEVEYVPAVGRRRRSPRWGRHRRTARRYAAGCRSLGGACRGLYSNGSRKPLTSPSTGCVLRPPFRIPPSALTSSRTTIIGSTEVTAGWNSRESKRERVNRASTSRRSRVDSRKTAAADRRRWSGVSAVPSSSACENPWIEVRGVRNSCAAEATKPRRDSSLRRTSRRIVSRLEASWNTSFGYAPVTGSA